MKKKKNGIPMSHISSKTMFRPPARPDPRRGGPHHCHATMSCSRNGRPVPTTQARRGEADLRFEFPGAQGAS